MKRLSLLMFSVAVLGSAAVFLSSCKEDEEPVRVTVNFNEPSLAVAEGDQNIKATIILDKPAPEDILVEYDLGGTATRKVGTISTGDYELVGTVGRITIRQGETSADIVFNIVTDAVFEGEEKIIISLEETNNPNATIGDDDQMEITIAGTSLTASFVSTSATVKESDEGIHEVMVQINQAASSPIVLTYDLGAYTVAGNALDSLTGFNQDIPSDFWDYYIDGVSGQVTIPAGQTTAAIRINVWSDFIFENQEKIEITLKPATGITIGTNAKFTLNVAQEDGKLVALSWPRLDEDMDLFVWLKVENDWFPFVISAFGTAQTQSTVEARIFPNVVLEGLLADLGSPVQFAGSYTYYSGTANPLNFRVQFADVVNGAIEPEANRDIFNASYTLANINPWDTDPGTDPVRVQTWQYSGGTFNTFSTITIPTTGSRQAAMPLPAGLKRGTNILYFDKFKLRR